MPTETARLAEDIAAHSGGFVVDKGDFYAVITDDDVKRAEQRYRTAAKKAEAAREARNSLVRAALEAGWTHARISAATGLTRGRIGQIAQADKR